MNEIKIKQMSEQKFSFLVDFFIFHNLFFERSALLASAVIK